MIAIMFDAVTDSFPAALVRTRRIDRGQWLFHRDDPVRSMFFVGSGCVELVRHSSVGKPTVLQRAMRGSVLAEASAFSDRYHCDAIAVEPTRAAEVARKDFLALVGRDPDFAARWMAYLSRQVQSARIRAEVLSLKTVADRLDAWIGFHGADLPARGDGTALARQIGVSPEALYREIARRRRAGTASGAAASPGL